MTEDAPRTRYVRPRSGSTRSKLEVLERFAEEARLHRAARPPWIGRLADADPPSLERELRDFATWYAGYSQWFPLYLRAVIDSLEDSRHRDLLEANLAEERGTLTPEDRAQLTAIGIPPHSVEGVPHPELFRRFCDAIGVKPNAHHNPPLATQRWRSAFRRLLETGGSACAVGALGLGTESIVPHFYRALLDPLRRTACLSREDYVFFELHCHVDDQHQADLLTVAGDLVHSPGRLEQVRHGMNLALELRASFFDAFACRPPASGSESRAS